MDDFTFLGCTKRTHESLEDVLTAIVSEEHTEFHLRAVGETYRVRLALSSALRVTRRWEAKEDIVGYRTRTNRSLAIETFPTETFDFLHELLHLCVDVEPHDACCALLNEPR